MRSQRKMVKNYCEFDVKSVTVQDAVSALWNIKNNQPKEADAIIGLLNEIGFKIDFKDNQKIAEVSVQLPDVYDTWEIRALSKKLIARKDLEKLVAEKEDRELEEAYTEDEIASIIDRAASMECYFAHRTEAVYRAYQEYREYQDMVDEENERAHEEEEFDDNNKECEVVKIPVIIIKS